MKSITRNAAFFIVSAILLVGIPQSLQSQQVIDSLGNLLQNASRSERVDILCKMAFALDDQISSREDVEDKQYLLSRLDEVTQEAVSEAFLHGDNKQKAQAHKARGFFLFHSQRHEEMYDYHAKALEFLKASGDVNAFSNEVKDLGLLYSSIDPAKAIETFSQILSVDFQQVEQNLLFEILFNLGINYYFQGNYNRSLELFTDLHARSLEILDTLWIGRSLNALGIAAYTGGDYNKALEYYMESLKIREHIGDKGQIASAMVNIGNVHKAIKSWEMAKDYYLKALQIFDEIDEKRSMATCYNNIGIIYEEDKNYDEAEAYYTESLKINEVLRDSSNLMMNYINLGSLYKNTEKYSSALSSYRKALNIAHSRGDRRHIALVSNNVGDVYFEQGRYNESLPFFYSSLEIAKELGIRDIIALNYKSLSHSHEQMNNTSEALKFFKLFFEVREELINEGNQKAIAEMQTKYDTEKKEQQIVLMNKDMELRDAVIKRDRFVKISMGVGIAFIFIFAGYVFIQLQDKKRKNILLARQNDEIQKQKGEIECQRDLLSKQKQEITDSIRYAQRIQKAILPPETLPNEILPEHFILFKPRDIVSGDFYWINKHANRTFVVAADCTGHGVPGAFMSMLGVAFLNEIVMYHNHKDSDRVLLELRKLVISTLAQSGQKEETKDGMDLSLCVIDWDAKTLQYSGAYNPLYFFRNGEFNEIKADKMPIGAHIKDQNPFTKHEISIEQGDTFYIFSDGYVDQFGGEDGRKFMTKTFKQLLADIQPKPLSQQIEILDNTLIEWRGVHEQVDDICIIGFRF